jgi:hypothetical protein
MRRNNKTAAKVFTFMLCLTLLTGCSSTGNDSDKGGNTVTATQSPDAGTDNGDKNQAGNTDDKNNTDEGKSSEEITNTVTPDAGNENTDETGKAGEDSGKSGDNASSTEDFTIPAQAAYKKINVEYKNKDLETSFVPGDCTSIVFSENSINAVGKETEISNVNGRQIIRITKKGDYLISGSCSNGQIIVEADKEKDVRLILNGLSLSCADSAPIYEQQCDKMVITLADGSENVLSSDSEYVYDNVEKKHPDAVIFAKDDLVINGNGKLTVDSAYMEGIHSTDSVKLISGNITVSSGDTGVRGKEAVIIKEADLNVTSKGDGIKTTYSDNASLGYVIIEGGNIKVYSARDGIQATGHIQITGGKFDITTDNGVAHAGSEEESKSAKGIKTEKNIFIKGADITVNAAEDAINANGNVIFDDGNATISSYDDAVQADGEIVVNSGSVTVTMSNKGIKGKSVSINGGAVTVASTDDGIKASSGKDEDEDSKVIFGDADAFAAPEDVYIAVTGGTVKVTTDSDCLDSDGNLYITGGSIILDGAKAKEDGGVSYGGVAAISGGSVEAAGVGDIKDKILNKIG